MAVKEVIATAPTVSDVMVQTMVNWGGRHVFGMVGHSNLGMAEAVRKQETQGNLTFFGIRHEGAASFACSAYAKLSGKPAACLTIAGPGTTNLLTGLGRNHVGRGIDVARRTADLFVRFSTVARPIWAATKGST